MTETPPHAAGASPGASGSAAPVSDVRPPAGKLALAWLALAWERLWPALWPMVAVASVFATVALLDWLPRLGGWGHAAALAAFGLALLAAYWRGFDGFDLPDRHQARRRLERDSGLDHRPLTGLDDALAGGAGDAETRALWQAHRRRLAQALGRLSVRWPSPGLAARDPFGVRGLLALVLLVAVVVAGSDWRDRVGRAFEPRFAAAAAAGPALDLFITPPDYTGAAPRYLSTSADDAGAAADPAGADPGAAGPIAVPEGSVLLARVSGGGRAPVLRVDGEETAFEPVDDGIWELERPIDGGTRLAVDQGRRTLGAWTLDVVPDAPPQVAFVEPPSATTRWATRLQGRVGDDYGVESAAAVIRLTDAAPEALAREPLTLPIDLPGRLPTEAEAVAYHDLTPHPWAGLPVTVELTATDAAGQTGRSAPEDFVLPERPFEHPVARAIVDQRRALFHTPDAVPIVADTLEALSLRPDRFRDDVVVFLALRTSFRRLQLADDGDAAIAAVAEVLWETALRIEDGSLSLAERALRDAQQALREALQGDADEAELRRLMDELRQAMDDYMQALQQQMAEQMQRGEMPPMMQPSPDGRVMTGEQFQEMLDEMMQRMEDMAQSGLRDQAREMLSQLQSMMENLQAGMMPMPQQSNPAMEMLDDLQALTEAQRQLLDQTFRQGQQMPGQQGQPGQPGQPGQRTPGQGGQPGEGLPQDPAAAAALQEALRRALGELMAEMGEMTGDIPLPFGRAEQAMRQSENALGQGRPGDAVDPQTQALDQLQQGLQGLADQIMEQMAQQNGGQGMPMPQQSFGQQDPLGRPMPNAGGADTRAMDLPEEADVQRARRILEELRDRLGDRERPALERDYIERLLERF